MKAIGRVSFDSSIHPKPGEPAPPFEAQSTYGTVRLDDFKDTWLILLSHPGDFCPAWSSDIKRFAERYSQLRKLNCELLGIGSRDSNSPLMWPKSVKEQFGVKIWFPVIFDPKNELAEKYGMVDPKNEWAGVRRSICIIDDSQILRAIIYYSPGRGETMDEIIRLVGLLQTSNASGIVTPENWRPGDEWILTAPKQEKQMVEEQVEVGEKEPELWYF